MKRKRENGFTLVEVVVALVIFVLISGVILSVLLTGKVSWYMGTTHIELTQDFRWAMDWLMDDLRQAGSGSITNVPPDGNWRTAINFFIPSGESGGYVTWDFTPIVYSLGGINNTQLLRTHGNEQRTLANSVVTFQVRRSASSPGMVEVQMQAQKRAVSYHLVSDAINFQLKLRN
ncbi:MAG: prepilin-type N-terminal cleavage/methylation domain-containing protein [Candidatus Omnitrophota bacterium]